MAIVVAPMSVLPARDRHVFWSISRIRGVDLSGVENAHRVAEADAMCQQSEGNPVFPCELPYEPPEPSYVGVFGQANPGTSRVGRRETPDSYGRDHE
jgi:hypothetical protein